jgi:hypothetical protein
MLSRHNLERWQLLRKLERAAVCGDAKAAALAIWFHDWIVQMALE